MKVYRSNILEGLRYLSSKELQKIAWFENDQGICSSFNDEVAIVYEENGLEDAFKAGHIVFSREADNALRLLDKMVMEIDDYRDERDLIDSPEMELIRQMAAQCIALIEASDGSESTVELIDLPPIPPRTSMA